MVRNKPLQNIIHKSEVLMKKFIQLSLLAAAAIIFSTFSANAQTVTKIDTKIPFDFSLGGRTYQAGDYHLAVITTLSGHANLTIRDNNGNSLDRVIVNRSGEKRSGEPELVFNRYINNRFLAKISIGSGEYSLIRSDAEKEALEKNKRQVADLGSIRSSRF
jgi:hypothetical protein